MFCMLMTVVESPSYMAFYRRVPRNLNLMGGKNNDYL